MIDWDDLKVFLAVSREGTLSGAARVLAVNHSTVFRRLNALEAKLDVRLFERLPGGYQPTVAGDALSEAAGKAEAEIVAAERKLAGQDLRLGGTLRITMTDTLARLFLPSLIAPFKHRYPEIEVELVVSRAFLNLTKRDADIAIRPTNNPPESLVGRRLCGIASAIYGHVDHVDHAGDVGDWAHTPWVAPDDSLAHLAAARWLRDLAPPVAIRVNSVSGMLEAVKAGLGLAALPCFMGDPEPGLRRVGGIVPELETGLWALTHADLRRTGRVRAFLDFIAETVAGIRESLEGGTAVS